MKSFDSISLITMLNDRYNLIQDDSVSGLILIESSQERMLKDLTDLYYKFSFIFLLDVKASYIKGKLSIDYILLNLEYHQRVVYRFPLDHPVEGVSHLWASAQQLEKYLSYEYGVHFLDKKVDSSFIDIKNSKIFPKRVGDSSGFHQFRYQRDNYFKRSPNVTCDFSEGLSVLSYGSSYKEFGGGDCFVEHDGEKIFNCVFESFKYFQDIEQLMTKTRYDQLVHQSVLLGPSLALCDSVVVADLIEKTFQVTLSDHDQIIRMIFLELERAYNHFVFIENLAASLEIDQVFRYANASRFLLLEFFQQCGLEPLMPKHVKLGGRNTSFSKTIIYSLYEKIKTLKSNLGVIEKNITQNRFLSSELSEGVLTPQEALAYSVTGPALRASGVNYDLRKNSPLYFYSDVEFDIPLGVRGSSYDRYLVRVEEIRQSFKIIDQLLDNIPPQNINHSMLFPFGEKSLSIEGPMYNCIESPEGELGFFVDSQRPGDPYFFGRAFFRTPSLASTGVVEHIIKASTIDSFFSVVSSLKLELEEMRK